MFYRYGLYLYVDVSARVTTFPWKVSLSRNYRADPVEAIFFPSFQSWKPILSIAIVVIAVFDSTSNSTNKQMATSFSGFLFRF
jgi:hypothetical protein